MIGFTLSLPLNICTAISTTAATPSDLLPINGWHHPSSGYIRAVRFSSINGPDSSLKGVGSTPFPDPPFRPGPIRPEIRLSPRLYDPRTRARSTPVYFNPHLSTFSSLLRFCSVLRLAPDPFHVELQQGTDASSLHLLYAATCHPIS
ncbi:hypothetical protein PIB30_057693 [Stylosanthes scabra]|uniref:Uncharacterized protein n=1 Tax=Stylosanthes scabra TaxID=79078 RepID=A0ABU6UIT5_9FABA|nr:hypothetical protein [Stylosanthes scabra]